jgi:transposase
MGRPQTYAVHLTPEQRDALEQVRDRDAGRRRARAAILLGCDAGDTDQEVADEAGVHVATVRRLRRRCAERGPEVALGERPRPGVAPKLDGKRQATVVALACSPAPEGHARWSVRLLARRLVELEVVESISRETIRRVLKKTR